MTYPLRFALCGFALSLAVAAAGCRQGVGERCQVDGDCQDGMTCVIPASMSVASGGSCQPVGTGPDGGDDAGPVAADLATTDQAAAPDLVSAGDGGAGDGGAGDLASPDDMAMSLPGDMAMASNDDLALPDLIVGGGDMKDGGSKVDLGKDMK